LRHTNIILKRLYTDPSQPTAFTSAQNIYKHAKRILPKLTLKNVRQFLETLQSYTLHKQIRHRFTRRPIIATQLNLQFQADLIDVQLLAPKNDGFRYILTCIDVLSRFAFAYPIKRKYGSNIIPVFKRIFKQRKPQKLQVYIKNIISTKPLVSLL